MDRGENDDHGQRSDRAATRAGSLSAVPDSLRMAGVEYSPLLAVLTGLLEAAAGLWIFLSRSPGRKRILFPVGLIFFLLAGYQFAEVAVCARPEHKFLTQLAYLDITWLPPLGLWLVFQLNFPKNRWIRTAAIIDFGLALAFSVWILADSGAITKSVCQTVIARYFPTRLFDMTYGVYYQLSLMLTVFAATAGMAAHDDFTLRRHLANVQTGLLGFLFPAIAVRVLSHEPEGLLPSVMCHFAIAFAASLYFLALRERQAVI
jgi:hypothetical protein